MKRLRGEDLLALALVIAAAAGARFWYLAMATNGGAKAPAFVVQGEETSASLSPADAAPAGQKPSQFEELVHNLREYNWFGGHAPLFDAEEATAHVAPGYYWLFSTLVRFNLDAPFVMRWTQAVFGVLTAVCYFFFARRAFQSTASGFFAGLLAAVHPFWIINTAELADGTLATFLVALVLALGARCSQVGGALPSLVLGLVLAAVPLVRASLLPFALVAMIWFLLRCRTLRGGWFCALLAFLGFANGLAPWTVRNFQEFGEIVPVADSACLHLWLGNNPRATGGHLDEAELRATLPAERLQELLAETYQARRYAMLGKDVAREIADDPSGTAARRLAAGSMFLLGDNWFAQGMLGQMHSAEDDDTTMAAAPALIAEMGEGALRGSLLFLLVMGLLGWRLSFGWRQRARLATIAALAIPLPYLLSHADVLSGPRLPWDGVLICYTAYVLASCLPGALREPLENGKK